jgi:FMN phosphatase YigB (HAD superfamily)
MKIRALFFDLDDTLFDCCGQLVEAAHRDAIDAMIRCGLDADADEALIRRLAIHEASPGCDIDCELAESYGAGGNEAIIRAGRDAFYDRDVGEITLFNGACEMLERLRKEHLLFLVTVGAVRTQAEKVKKLGLLRMFTEVAYLDVERGLSKKSAFYHLVKKYSLDPAECVAIGNRVDSEIRDANSAGMKTVLITKGEFAHLAPKDKNEEPDYRVENVTGLEDILQKITNI